MPQGLKPRSLWAFNGTTKQAAEKLERNRESVEEFRSGPKGRTHSVSFTARPRWCPDTWCVFERVFPQPVKPCPFEAVSKQRVPGNKKIELHAEAMRDGTNLTILSYYPTMQCVATLSWSMSGLMTPAFVPAARRKPSARGSFNPMDAGSGQQRVREQSAAGATAAPAARAASVEVSKLEQDRSQDWTQLARRCMDGDSGAWAEMVRTHQRRVYGLCYRFTGNRRTQKT